MPETERRDRLQEIEEMQRAILARMDESDRRAAQREREREQKRADQPSTHPVALPSPEVIRETFDKFFQILEEMRRKLDRVN